MKNKLALITALFICVTLHLNAQNRLLPSYGAASAFNEADDTNGQPLNFIKINVTALVLKNYSFQYERVLNKSFSIALSYRTMPSTTIPFKKLILNAIGDDDDDTREVIETFKLSNSAITPEIRFYIGKKGYGQGFYIAPFYRHANFKTNTLTFDYENSLNVESSINLSGKLTTNTGGILFGAQWALGKHLLLDWWIMGPHFGSGNGNFSGVPSKPLTPDEQNELRQELEDLDIPFTNKTVNVNANSASLKLDGPWAGVRSGILFGFRF